MKDEFTNTSHAEQGHSPADERDSMAGSLLFEAFCGGALWEAFTESVDMPEGASELDVGNALDFYDEIRADRANGGFAIDVKMGVKKALYGMFNHLGEGSNNVCGMNAASSEVRGLGSFATARPSFM